MAELADALDLGSSTLGCGSSTLPARTKLVLCMYEIIIILLTIISIGVILTFYIVYKTQKSQDLKSQIAQVESNLKDETHRVTEDLNLNFNTMLNNNDRLLSMLNTQLKEKMENLDALISRLLNDISLKQEKLIASNEDKLDKFTQGLISQSQTIEKSLGNIRDKVDERLDKIRLDNENKLEQIRKTVDDKLQESLDRKLSESFKQVSESLDIVSKGLGEMRTLANGVGDLKKVLTNVKNRGIFGELQLEKILDDILNPSLYSRNVKTKPSSNEVVEFAIKLPGNREGEIVWLPVDSKFPIENYQRLIEYYESGNVSQIASTQKALEQNIKQSAKDIKSKYIEVPYTTDFGIMFLPYEGLYSEVLRIDGLFESIMKDYKIVITGPTTLAAFLNSLQMGFRTLAIEKNASKVMEILSQVKKEFENFGSILEKAQKNIKDADKELDVLAGVRSRKIQLALKDIESS